MLRRADETEYAYPTPPMEERGMRGGMTLRDWFAGQWIAAGNHQNLNVDEAADQAYDMADAMLRRRENLS